MKKNKIIIILIIINIITIGIIYNFIKKDYLKNEKIIVKAMTEAEYEDYITSLNQSHIDYAKHIQESKTKIASAITDMGVTTSSDDSPETMSSNIRSIARNASSITYDNTSSGLTSTNVQGAVDELNDSLGNLKFAQDAEGKWGYIPSGADSVIPFKQSGINKIIFRIEVGASAHADHTRLFYYADLYEDDTLVESFYFWNNHAIANPNLGGSSTAKEIATWTLSE